MVRLFVVVVAAVIVTAATVAAAPPYNANGYEAVITIAGERCKCLTFYLCDKTQVVPVPDGEVGCSSQDRLVLVCCQIPGNEPIPFETNSTTQNPDNIPDVSSVQPIFTTSTNSPETTKQFSIYNTTTPKSDNEHNQANQSCTCVPRDKCLDFDKDEYPDIDSRFGCDTNLVCCKMNNSTSGNNSELPDRLPDIRSCGIGMPRPNNYLGTRVLSTEEQAKTYFGEFPWMVSILKSSVNKLTYKTLGNVLCGGSLIHPQVILTTAHCVSLKPDKLLIRAGEWNINTDLKQTIHQDRDILKIIKHEKYYRGALYNDIALIILKERFILGDNVGTVCLPSQGYQYNSRERCYVSGWEKNEISTDYATSQNILKKIDVPIMSRSTCLNILRRTGLKPDFKLHESFMCAGGETGKGICNGDGGNPLVCPVAQDLQYFQSGIVSWGIGCGNMSPVVYVDVSQFRDWIDQHMDNEQMEKSYYDSEYRVSHIQPQ